MAKHRWRGSSPALFGFLIATGLGLLLFLPWLSIRWDPNGIMEARAIERGALLTPNHLLYRPLASLLLEGARLAGYAPPPAQLYQILTATISALGLGAFFVAVLFLARSQRAAAFATLFYATTWAYWTFSTDIYYISLAAACASAALAVLAFPAKSWRGLLFAAILYLLAVLSWQASILILPALALVHYRRMGNVRHTLIWTASALALVGAVFIVIGMLVVRAGTVPALFTWLTSHSSDAAGRPALWGQVSVARLRPLALSVASSFIPLWEGLGISSLGQGVFKPEFLLRQFSLVALVGAAALTILRAWRKRADWGSAAAVALGYAALLPFNFWWDAAEPKWFVVANLFLIAGAGVLWAGAFTRIDYGVLGACIAVIALANFTSTILPRHVNSNPNLALAECVAHKVDARDAVLLTEWDWMDYAIYFYHYPGNVISLIGSGDRQGKLDRVARAVATAKGQGGEVYLRDPASMSEEDRALATSLTGLDPSAFAQFRLDPGFQCPGGAFVQVR